jgi:Holliday junction resolvasome RuvABC endonuclease subunit
MSPIKKRGTRKRSRLGGAVKTTRQSSPSRPTMSDHRRLLDLAEALEIMLPELTARIAAIEHLLIEKQIGTRNDLMEARKFVDLREADRH